MPCNYYPHIGIRFHRFAGSPEYSLRIFRQCRFIELKIYTPKNDRLAFDKNENGIVTLLFRHPQCGCIRRILNALRLCIGRCFYSLCLCHRVGRILYTPCLCIGRFLHIPCLGNVRFFYARRLCHRVGRILYTPCLCVEPCFLLCGKVFFCVLHDLGLGCLVILVSLGGGCISSNSGSKRFGQHGFAIRDIGEISCME